MNNYAAAASAKARTPEIARFQMLITVFLCFVAAAFGLMPDFPFHAGFYRVALLSGIVHLAVWLFFDRVFPVMRNALLFLSYFNLILMGFALHYTGGIISPFSFIFFCIIAADAIYGVDYPGIMAVAIGSYTMTICLEYFRILPDIGLTAGKIYGDGFNTLLIVLVTAAFLFVYGAQHRILLRSLRKDLEKEEKERLILLKEMAKLDAPSQMGLFADKILHDLKGPLGAFSGFMQLLSRKDSLSPEDKEDCLIMLQESKRTEQLLQQLVKYVKPGGHALERIRPKDLVENLLAVIKFYKGAGRIGFKADFSAPDTALILGNREQLQQAYFNILKNSVEALQESAGRGSVKVKIYTEADMLCIGIEDNGPGIPASLLNKAALESFTSKKEGSGLGLMIVKEVMAAHGGAVSVTSREGAGTSVLTKLPLARGT